MQAASDAIGEADRLRSEIESLKADKENQDSTFEARLKDLRIKYAAHSTLFALHKWHG